MYSSADNFYCYPDSFTLKNLHDVRDPEVLAEAEAYAYAVRNGELLNNPPTFELSFRFLKFLHQYLFQDMYEWAGQTRRVDISVKSHLFCNFLQSRSSRC